MNVFGQMRRCGISPGTSFYTVAGLSLSLNTVCLTSRVDCFVIKHHKNGADILREKVSYIFFVSKL